MSQKVKAPEKKEVPGCIVVWSLHALFTNKHTLLSSHSEDPGNPGDKSTIA